MSDSSSQTNNKPLTAGDWLRDATRLLAASGVQTARLDCLVLLSDALGHDRSHILAHLDQPLQDHTICDLNDAIQRRSSHTPLAYIRGKAEFYGRTFAITPDVLVPRPETESIIELLLTHCSPQAARRAKHLTVVDIGTGSGILAITAALSLPHATVYATDIDAVCLDVAARNAQNLGATVQFEHGNLLEPLKPVVTAAKHAVLLCNLPYVPTDYPVNRAARQEPKLALFAGQDGLDAFRELFGQISTLADAPLVIISESLPNQHAPLACLARQHGYILAAREGLAQLFIRRYASLPG